LPNETWQPEFLYLWLRASYQDLRDLSEDRGGNQANLNGALLNALEIPAPNLDEQMKIVARANAVLSEIATLENSSKAALEDLLRLPNRILAQAFEV
jgi:type I restriction enzyme S subunit